jgi:hypothetical protein
MKHANGQNGQHHMAEASPPVWQHGPQAYAAPAGGGNGGLMNIAKGYIPLGLAGSCAIALIIGSFTVGQVWEKQQSTIATMQKDVDKLAVGQEMHSAKLNRIEQVVEKTQAAVQKIADQPPWYVSVKAAQR